MSKSLLSDNKVADKSFSLTRFSRGCLFSSKTVDFFKVFLALVSLVGFRTVQGGYLLRQEERGQGTTFRRVT